MRVGGYCDGGQQGIQKMENCCPFDCCLMLPKGFRSSLVTERVNCLYLHYILNLNQLTIAP
jgi:hypothetical protein